MEFPFERSAMKGKPLPRGLDVADSCAYVALKNLYSMYFNRSISRVNAKEEKSRIIYNWIEAKSKLKVLDRESIELRDRIGEASKEYEENPCIETGDRLYAAFYNIPDDWRRSGNGRK